MHNRPHAALSHHAGQQGTERPCTAAAAVVEALGRDVAAPAAPGVEEVGELGRVVGGQARGLVRRKVGQERPPATTGEGEMGIIALGQD